MTRNPIPEKPEDLSVFLLLGRLKLPQLWTIGASIVGILSGSFVLGYNASQYSAKINSISMHDTLRKATDEKDDPQKQLQEAHLKANEQAETINTLTQSTTFFQNYERYLITDYYEKTGLIHHPEQAKQAHDILVDQVLEWWKQQMSSTLTGGRIEKGFRADDSRMVFLSGTKVESVFVIPPEIKDEVLRLSHDGGAQ
jgi:hypothetical protein